MPNSNQTIQAFEQDVTNLALPHKFTYPFCYQPHPLAVAAAEQLQQQLLGYHPTDADQQGRMYGVLVIETAEGELGFLSALSGNAVEKPLQSLSETKINFVPTIYQAYAQSDYEQEQQVVINDINAQIAQLTANPDITRLNQLLTYEETRFSAEIASLQQQMRDNKKMRKAKRQWLEEQLALQSLPEDEYRQISISLSRDSVTDKKTLQALKFSQQESLTKITSNLTQLTDEIAQLKKVRKKLSSKLQKHFFKQYQLLNNLGERKDLISIFADTILQKPPAGSGDCAAPKLLQYAFEHNLRPICMAEFWWGQQPSSEIRKHKQFYPACQSKCQPILAHMLKGMTIDENPLLTNPAENTELEIVFSDEHVVVVNKPAGLLSVPGKSISDSVYTRINAMFPEAKGSLIIHRLDMATSGLLMLALTERAHKHLQQQFINKEVSKRYVAVIDGEVSTGSGKICLPLRGDFDDRPRQMVCHQYGKYAETHWQLIETKAKRSKLFLYPITGRTHQLRMHCAHPDGLNMPIIGDSLYGKKANRLHLHAQRLSFVHPITKEQLTFEINADF